MLGLPRKSQSAAQLEFFGSLHASRRLVLIQSLEDLAELVSLPVSTHLLEPGFDIQEG